MNTTPRRTILGPSGVFPGGNPGDECFVPISSGGGFHRYTMTASRTWSHDGRGEYRKTKDGDLKPVPTHHAMGGYTQEEHRKWLDRQGFAI